MFLAARSDQEIFPNAIEYRVLPTEDLSTTAMIAEAVS